jgi:hypothetical protein
LQTLAATASQRDTFGHNMKLSYNLHHKQDNPTVLVGSAVVDVDRSCPAFSPNVNSNIFGHYFEVKFVHNGHTYVRAISPFKFVSYFQLTNKLTYQLSQHCNYFCINTAIPLISLALIFKQILNRCIHVCSQNFKIHEPNQFAPPSACVETFLNGTIGVQMQSCKIWVKEYAGNLELLAVLKFVENPGTISQCSLNAAKLDPNYCQALWQSCIHLDNGIFYYHEPIAGSESYTKLQIVPAK